LVTLEPGGRLAKNAPEVEKGEGVWVGNEKRTSLDHVEAKRDKALSGGGENGNTR